MSVLSKYQINTGRRLYGLFSALNSASFALVTGNVLVVYALYLNAGNVAIGLINAFGSLSFFAIPLGKLFAQKRPIIRIYADSWVLRNCSLLFMVPIPFLANMGLPEWGLFCILISTFGFNFFRGIGLVANNPVLSDLTPGKDRGSFLVFLSVVNNAAALITILLLAIALHFADSLIVLSVAVIVGIVLGFIASFLLYKMPSSTQGPTASSGSFSKNFIGAIHDRNFRLFIAAFSVIGLGVGMARPFIAVYCREVYMQPDSVITFITFFMTLGALSMGLVSRVFIDKIGAKPMYLLFTALSLLSLVPALISPNFTASAVIFLFLSVFAFSANLGFSGQENAGQTYFFGLIPQEAVMDMGIVYFLVMGATGASGSLLGGVLLDAFKDTGLSAAWVYRIFFGLQIIVIGIALWIEINLKSLGSYSLKEALPLFFSPRDIRGLGILYKLDRSTLENEQTTLLSELRLSNTAAAASQFAEHLHSPSYAVRMQALAAMESLPSLNKTLEEILIRETETGVFTTASKAARILGLFKVKRSVSVLKKQINSPDYLLSGECMTALARIGATKAQLDIGHALAATENAHILLKGIRAMELYADPSSVFILLDVLRMQTQRPEVQHEIMLALAAIMGIGKAFYPAYSQYIENADEAETILTDLFDEISARKKLSQNTFPPLIGEFLKDPSKADDFCASMHVYTKQHGGLLCASLVGCISEADFTSCEAFRFFLCFWALMLFGNKKLMEK
ncbi:MFS transporter [Treponema sp. OMZ 840]|uniref:MFS transporter n=1 Tax=Treponema sp. OMZ 840 TaxID=244313 RepID=UPI003D8FAB87